MNSTIGYLRKFLSETIINIYTISDEILYKVYPREVKLIESILEDVRRTCVTWSVEDFEGRAEERKGENWRDFYDESKFEEALESMIHHHDAEYGITWDSVDYYLDEMCTKKEVEEEVEDEVL